MKKLIAVLLSLTLLCGMAGALADYTLQIRDSSGEIYGWENFQDNGTSIDRREYHSGGYTHEYYDENGKLDVKAVYEDQKNDEPGNYKVYDKEGNLIGYSTWLDNESKGTYTGADYDSDGNVKTMYAGDDQGTVIFDGNGKVLGGWVNGLSYDSDAGKWFDENGNEAAAPDVSAYLEGAEDGLRGKKQVKVVEPIWYGNNTAGVIGISLRDQYPGLTDKWYHVLPVDLSRDGTQVFDLVASARYFLGKVNVTVNGDSVTVDYAYISSPYGFEIYPKEECLAWFRSAGELTTDYLANPTPNASFGQAISKERDLNGQDYALLFICNRVTYRVPLNRHGMSPREYWQNSTKMADYFAGKKQLLEQVEAEYAEKQAAAEDAEAQAEPAAEGAAAGEAGASNP